MSLLLIAVCVVMVVGAAAFFLWMIHMCLNKVCPVCRENEGTEEMAFPVLPGFIWWCLGCNSTIKQKDLLDRRRD
jgi:hypothetical protein